MFRKSLNFSSVLDSYALFISSKAVKPGVPAYLVKIKILFVLRSAGLDLFWTPYSQKMAYVILILPFV